MRARGSLVALACALASAAPAAALGPPSAWDGVNPFDCVLQNAGFEAEVPNPEADPFCVEYDKTHQNVTELGVVEFLSKEPARVALTNGKCFYFQHDHWRGSIVQEDGSTETYNWDGSYFYNRASGDGGVYVENFTFNDKTQDPRELPGFPESYKPYFGPGRGGTRTANSVPVDPGCVEKAKEDDPAAPTSPPDRCKDYRGKVERAIGPLRLGVMRSRAESSLGPPARRMRGFARWCLMDGGKFMAHFRGGRADFLLTTSRGFDYRGLRVGSAERGARRIRRFRTWTLVIGVRKKRVTYLAVASQRLSNEEIRKRLKDSR